MQLAGARRSTARDSARLTMLAATVEVDTGPKAVLGSVASDPRSRFAMKMAGRTRSGAGPAHQNSCGLVAAILNKNFVLSRLHTDTSFSCYVISYKLSPE